MKEYEEKAVALALNRSKLQDLTDRLKAARMTCPLFDTKRWVSSSGVFFTATFLYQLSCPAWGSVIEFVSLQFF